MDKGCSTVAGFGGMELWQKFITLCVDKDSWGPGEGGVNVCYPAQEMMLAAKGAHSF